MRIAEAILQYLKLHEVDYIFGIPAGTISPIFDAMNDVDIQPIITKNESGASFCATRYACLAKKLAVCIGAGGVGVSNMINGIADAKRSKAPVLVISGFVHRWQMGKGAIQEQDAVDIFTPITKYSKMLLEPEDVLNEIREAIKIACTAPQGPVYICIPVDIQASDFNGVFPEKVMKSDYTNKHIDFNALENAIEIINKAEHGIIMAGKGCRGMAQDIMDLSEHLQWPIITTPSGKGVIPSEFDMNLGNYGFTSADLAEQCVEKGPATCLLALGTSLGEASTGNFSKVLLDGKKLIHIDSDSSELGKVFETDLKLSGDLNTVLPKLIKGVKKAKKTYVKPICTVEDKVGNHKLSLKVFFDKIHEVLPPEIVYLCDIGEYMNFALKHLNIPKGSEFEFSINFGAMGSAIGGAPGAYMANKNKRVAVFAGDGCFFMNGMEILTAKEYNLPIIYFIINNSMLGYVEHGHQYLYGRTLKCFSQKRIEVSELAKGMGIKSMQISSNEQIDQIKDFVLGLNEPCIIEVVTDGSEPPPIVGRLKALKQFTAK